MEFLNYRSSISGLKRQRYRCNADGCSVLVLRGSLLDQHHVAIEVYAQQAERLIVRGPMKIHDTAYWGGGSVSRYDVYQELVPWLANPLPED